MADNTISNRSTYQTSRSQEIQKSQAEQQLKRVVEDKQEAQVEEQTTTVADKATVKGSRKAAKSTEALMRQQLKLDAPIDASMKKSLDELGKGIAADGQINRAELAKVIKDGAGDLDNQSAGTEFQQLKSWLDKPSDATKPDSPKNRELLTDDAKQLMQNYEKAVDNALKEKRTGLTLPEFNSLLDGTSPSSPEAPKAPASEKPAANAEPAEPASPSDRKAPVEATQPKPAETPEATMPEPGTSFRDKSAGEAITEFAAKNKTGPVSGEEMAGLIDKAITDRDNQAAGLEAKDLADYVGKLKSAGQLSPEAEKVYGEYEKTVDATLKKEKTGFDPATETDLRSRMADAAKTPAQRSLDDKQAPAPQEAFLDQSTKAAVEDFAKTHKGPVSGEDMKTLIEKGISDLDGKSAASEFRDVQQYADKLRKEGMLTPAAESVLGEYEKSVDAALKKGEASIGNRGLADLKKSMAEAAKTPGTASGVPASTDRKQPAADAAMPKPQDAFLDEGAGAVITGFASSHKGPVSGEDMKKLITDAKADLDGKGAGAEFRDIQKYADKLQSEGLLTPEAEKVFAEYQKTVDESLKDGKLGITKEQSADLEKRMAAAAQAPDTNRSNKPEGEATIPAPGTEFLDAGAGEAITKFAKDHPGGKVTGAQARDLINDATKDLDGNAAGAELRDLQKFFDGMKAGDALTPEAAQAFETYKAEALRAQATGETGIKKSDYDQMVGRMDTVAGGPRRGITQKALEPGTFDNADLGKRLNNLKSGPGDDVRLFANIENHIEDNGFTQADLDQTRSFVHANKDNLSKAAVARFAAFDSVASQALAESSKGGEAITFNEYRAMQEATARAKVD